MEENRAFPGSVSWLDVQARVAVDVDLFRLSFLMKFPNTRTDFQRVEAME